MQREDPMIEQARQWLRRARPPWVEAIIAVHARYMADDAADYVYVTEQSRQNTDSCYGE